MTSSIIFFSSDDRSLLNFRGDFIRSCVARGYEVHLVTPGDEGNFDTLSEMGVLIHKCVRPQLSAPVSYLKFLRDGIKFQRIVRPTFCLIFFVRNIVIFSVLCYMFPKTKFFCIIEGLGTSKNILQRSKLFRLLFSLIMRISVFRYSSIFFNNTHDMEFFVDNNIVSYRKCILLGGIGVDLDYWSAVRTVEEQNDVQFVFVGRLLKEKGVLEFCRAAQLVSLRFPVAKFVVVGDIDTNNPSSFTREDIRKFERNYPVLFVGHVNDVKGVLVQSQVLCLPSYYGEGLPRTIQEAMACAMPIITCKCPGSEEAIIPGKNGLSVPPRDYWALAAAMVAYVSDRELIYLHGQASRKIAEVIYDTTVKSSLIISTMED